MSFNFMHRYSTRGRKCVDVPKFSQSDKLIPNFTQTILKRAFRGAQDIVGGDVAAPGHFKRKAFQQAARDHELDLFALKVMDTMDRSVCRPPSLFPELFPETAK
jgi:hypothetical protein